MWPDRLANACRRLIRFINRFHRVSGFEHVVREYFTSKYHRAGIRLAMRFTRQLAKRLPDVERQVAFGRSIVFAPDGKPIGVVHIRSRGVRYQLMPWSRLHPAAVRKQFAHHMILFADPDKVRWVFDGQRSGHSKRDAVRAVRRILDRLPPQHQEWPGYRRWINALEMNLATPVRLSIWIAQPLTWEERKQLFNDFTAWYYDSTPGRL